MALFKTSSFAENSVNFRQSTRQEEKVLNKKLALMRTMHYQMEVNLGLNGKMITKRLRKNLERSVQTQSNIRSIKKSMPEPLCTNYRKESYGSAKALMEIWGFDENAGKISTLSHDVTLPASINLLTANGFIVDKEVTHKLDKLRQVHSQHQRLRTSSRRTRSKSLPHLERNGRQTNCTTPAISPPLDGATNYTQSAAFETGNSPKKVCSATSRSTNSSRESIEEKRRRMRSDTQPVVTNTLEDTLTWVTEARRSFSTTGLDKQYRPTARETATVNTNLEKGLEENLTDRPVSPSDSNMSIAESSSTMRIYGDGKDSDCPLKHLHEKINSCPEEITLVDLHKASVVTKDYPTRMKTFVKETQKFKIPESEKLDGLTGDYYSFRIQRDDKASCSGEGRRAMSAKVGAQPRSKSTAYNKADIIDDEQQYFDRARTAMTDSRQRSMTIKSLNTEWGPSEYIDTT